MTEEAILVATLAVLSNATRFACPFTILRPERSDQRYTEDAHGTTGGNEGTHQFFIGSRSGEDPDTLFAILFRQMLAHEEELLIDHQIMGGDYFFGLEEGIADLLVQLGIVLIA